MMNKEMEIKIKGSFSSLISSIFDEEIEKLKNRLNKLNDYKNNEENKEIKANLEEREKEDFKKDSESLEEDTKYKNKYLKDIGKGGK